MNNLSKHMLQLVGIAKTWATKHLPGWTEDSHRDLLTRHGARRQGDKVSALTMTVPMLSSVLNDYERRGWPRQKNFSQGKAEAKPVPPRIAHLVRLWGKLGQAGKVAKATRPALLAFCARQMGREVPDLDSLDVGECQAITEALKGWLGRV